MANVIVEMEPAVLSLRGREMAEDVPKPRKLHEVDKELWRRLRELEVRKQELAAERGAWKDASGKQRAAAEEVSAKIAAVKGQLQEKWKEGKDRELRKQAAAAERERKRRSD